MFVGDYAITQYGTKIFLQSFEGDIKTKQKNNYKITQILYCLYRYYLSCDKSYFKIFVIQYAFNGVLFESEFKTAVKEQLKLHTEYCFDSHFF